MSINTCIKNIANVWHIRPSATNEILNNIEKQMNLLLPSDFKHFMQWSNGGEAKLSKIYLSLWEAEKIILLNHEYKIQQYLGENILGIGSDGGPICFLLDYRDQLNPSFSSINFGDLDPKEIKKIASSFTIGMTMAITGALSDDDL